MYLKCLCFLQNQSAIINHEEFPEYTVLAGPGPALHVPAPPPYSKDIPVGKPPSYEQTMQTSVPCNQPSGFAQPIPRPATTSTIGITTIVAPATMATTLDTIVAIPATTAVLPISNTPPSYHVISGAVHAHPVNLTSQPPTNNIMRPTPVSSSFTQTNVTPNNC